MKAVFASDSLMIPSDVEIEVNHRIVVAKGKYGEISRDFRHITCDLYIKDKEEGKTFCIELWLADKKRRAIIRTLKSHVSNMITGVSKKFQYKMRLCYAHFPINVLIRDSQDTIEIRNFLGEKRVRVVKMFDGVIITKTPTNILKDELVLSGIDIDQVSQSAALIHQNTLVRKKDIRKFLDGIYVSEKGTVDV